MNTEYKNQYCELGAEGVVLNVFESPDSGPRRYEVEEVTLECKASFCPLTEVEVSIPVIIARSTEEVIAIYESSSVSPTNPLGEKVQAARLKCPMLQNYLK